MKNQNRLVTTACIFLSLSSVAASSETKDFNVTGLKTVAIENSSGEVLITGGSSENKVTVEIEKVRFSDKCNLEFSQKEGELRIVADEKGYFSRETCEVKFKIKAPTTASVRARMGSGDLKIENLTGGVNFRTGSGDVIIRSAVSKLEGLSGSGNVKATSLTAPVSVTTGSGEVELAYAQVPEFGEVNLKSGSGDIVLSFPPQSKFATDFWAGSGKLTNEFATLPEGAFKVVVKTGSGDLKIRKDHSKAATTATGTTAPATSATK